jgi:hypothetical protein
MQFEVNIGETLHTHYQRTWGDIFSAETLLPPSLRSSLPLTSKSIAANI